MNHYIIGRQFYSSDELYHHGILGMKWGVRRYQNKDGSLTAAGKERSMYRNRVIVNTKTTSAANKIVSTLSNEQKKLLGASENGDWINKKDELEISTTIAKRFIQKHEDVPVSMLEIYDDGSGVGEIAIATDNAYSGKGYASKNVQRAKRWVDSNKNKTINELLWSAHETNLASQNLAKKNGFVEIPNTFYGDTMNPKYKYYRYERESK